MKFKIGERALIVSASGYPFLVGHECIIIGYGNSPMHEYRIDIIGFPPRPGKLSWAAPGYALEKLKPSGWEKVSWDTMPWKPKELVS